MHVVPIVALTLLAVPLAMLVMSLAMLVMSLAMLALPKGITQIIHLKLDSKNIY
jgi:hypothetical protein